MFAAISLNLPVDFVAGNTSLQSPLINETRQAIRPALFDHTIVSFPCFSEPILSEPNAGLPVRNLTCLFAPSSSSAYLPASPGSGALPPPSAYSPSSLRPLHPRYDEDRLRRVKFFAVTGQPLPPAPIRADRPSASRPVYTRVALSWIGFINIANY